MSITDALPSWKPRRRGNVFCSPGCGAGCKYADFAAVRLAASKAARSLGPGWKVEVHENMGWHSRIRSADGRLTVRICSYGKKTSYLTATLKRSSGSDWTDDGRTAREAVLGVVEKARALLLQDLKQVPSDEELRALVTPIKKRARRSK